MYLHTFSLKNNVLCIPTTSTLFCSYYWSFKSEMDTCFLEYAYQIAVYHDLLSMNFIKLKPFQWYDL